LKQRAENIEKRRKSDINNTKVIRIVSKGQLQKKSKKCKGSILGKETGKSKFNRNMKGDQR
jgi:hypothetical protein